jgi:hypothetical protein
MAKFYTLFFTLILMSLHSFSQEKDETRLDSLSRVLGAEKFNVLEKASQVKLYYIKYYLIEGTEFDYGTKPYQVLKFKNDSVLPFLNQLKNKTIIYLKKLKKQLSTQKYNL